MGSLGRLNSAAIVAAALLFGSSAPTLSLLEPDTIETVAIIDDLLDAISADDGGAVDDAVDELLADGHWLPTAAWAAIDDGDLEVLSFVSLLFSIQPDELFVLAFDQVLVERDLISVGDELSPFEADLLDQVDGDGAMLLEVIDHHRLNVSPQLRGVLQPIPDSGPNQPVDLYDNALLLLTGRLEQSGIDAPDVGLDLDGDLLAPPMGPKPGPNGPTAPQSVDDASPTGLAIDETPSPVDDLADEVTEQPVGDASDAVIDEPIEVMTEQSPADPVVSGLGDATSSDRDPDDGLDPATIAFGTIAVIAILLALVALRGTRNSGRLADIAFTDALTGLANRRRLDDDLANETRQGDRPTAVLMIDVDHFKQFNDDHGHAVGDEVLRRVADIIAANVRDIDLPYRYGGEEFSVLLPDTGHDAAQVVGERVRAAIECAHFDVDGHPVSVTASIGLSTGPATEVSQLVRRADQALYTAKDNGRNQLARG